MQHRQDNRAADNNVIRHRTADESINNTKARPLRRKQKDKYSNS